MFAITTPRPSSKPVGIGVSPGLRHEVMPAMKKHKRILVIDDEEVIGFGFSVVLKEPGVLVDCAQTLEDARHLVATRRYNAAIVDLRLSDSILLEGFDCIRLLHSSQNACRIIVLTAYGEQEIRNQAMALGIDGFYEKPVEPATIRNMLAELSIYDD
jgi:DNA-binding response OmpR family regulator